MSQALMCADASKRADAHASERAQSLKHFRPWMGGNARRYLSTRVSQSMCACALMCACILARAHVPMCKCTLRACARECLRHEIAFCRGQVRVCVRARACTRSYAPIDRVPM
eukprot:5709155-Pleurochrysis_carterae.AAC.2